MPSPRTSLVFEDPIDARLHRFLAADDAELRIETLSEWLPRSYPSSADALAGEPERKREFFEALIPDDPASPHAAFARATLRRTLEDLRWADVVTEDDTALAFASLPDTPAYASLRTAALAMAELFADADLPSLSRGLSALEGPTPTFVARAGGSTVFRNVAAAAGGACVEPWGLDDESRRRRALRVDGNALSILPRLVDRVARSIARGKRALVLVAGTAAERLWLESALAAVGPVAVFPEPVTALPVGSPVWRALRTSRALSAAERLRWARRFDRLERQSTTTAVETLLHELRRDGVAEPAVVELSARWNAPSAAEPFSPNDDRRPARIGIAPLRAVGSAPGADVFVVLGEAAPESGPPTLLTPSDRGKLRAAGFNVADRPSVATTTERLVDRAGLRRAVFALGADVATAPAKLRLVAAERAPRDARWTIEALDDRAPKASATQLSTFAECPSKYVARYRWRWNPPEPPENEFQRWVGTLAHALLEHWHRQHPAVPSVGDAVRLRELFPSARATAFREGDGPPPSLEVAVRRRATALAARGLALEPALADRFGAAHTMGVELGFEWRRGERLFAGRYDRVIETKKGAVIVLDYKTGATAFSPSHATSGEDPQGALYWLSGVERFGDKFAGVLFVSLKEGSAERGILRKVLLGSPPTVRGHVLDETKWNDGLEAARAAMENKAELLWNERRFAPTPAADVCDRCGYGGLCRKRWGDV